MRMLVSSANGCGPQIEAFVKGLVRAIDQVNFVDTRHEGYDIVGTIEASEFDPIADIKRIVPQVGLNIVYAAGLEARVLCQVDRYPDIRWTNTEPKDSW